MAKGKSFFTITSSSHSQKGKSSITFEGAMHDIQRVEAAFAGHAWVRVQDGELHSCPAHVEPPLVPDPPQDECWPQKSDRGSTYVRSSYGEERKEDPHGAMYIQSLCGYDGGASYAKKAALMTEAGFEVLRSRRSGPEQKFWEIWYLPFASYAKGPCANMTSQEIREWVFKHVRPGTLVTPGAQWGLVLDD